MTQHPLLVGGPTTSTAANFFLWLSSCWPWPPSGWDVLLLVAMGCSVTPPSISMLLLLGWEESETVLELLLLPAPVTRFCDLALFSSARVPAMWLSCPNPSVENCQ